MHRITPVNSHYIREGQQKNIVQELSSLAELVMDGDYFHAARPRINTPLVNERFRSELSGLRVQSTTVPKPVDYVPVARVGPDALHLENADVPGFAELHGLILERARQYLSDTPYLPQPIQKDSGSKQSRS